MFVQGFSNAASSYAAMSLVGNDALQMSLQTTANRLKDAPKSNESALKNNDKKVEEVKALPNLGEKVTISVAARALLAAANSSTAPNPLDFAREQIIQQSLHDMKNKPLSERSIVENNFISEGSKRLAEYRQNAMQTKNENADNAMISHQEASKLPTQNSPNKTNSPESGLYEHLNGGNPFKSAGIAAPIFANPTHAEINASLNSAPSKIDEPADRQKADQTPLETRATYVETQNKSNEAKEMPQTGNALTAKKA